MPTRPPTKRPKPRAWRVTHDRRPPVWRRLLVPIGVLAVALGVTGGLGAAGVFGSRSIQSQASAAPVNTRPLVISSSSAVTATATPMPSAAGSPTLIGGTLEPAPTRPSFSAGPPALVQQVTPVGSGPAPSVAASPRASATTAPRASSGSIEGDLRSINATATALSERAASLSGSATPTRSGTARATATETPIPTAAPPKL